MSLIPIFLDPGSNQFSHIDLVVIFLYSPQVLPLFFLLLNLFYFWLHWVFVAVRGLSLLVASGGYSSLQCVGFSLRWLLLCGAWDLGSRASVVAARGLSSCSSRALERRLSSCGAWA